LLFFFEFGSQASLGIPLVSLLLLHLDPKLSLDSQLNAHLSDGMEDPSVSSALDSGLHPNPPRLVFPALFHERKDGGCCCHVSCHVGYQGLSLVH
jgi:hypothetical protein